MLIATILILIAWFVEMPLWLSIICTVFGGVTIVKRLIGIGFTIGK